MLIPCPTCGKISPNDIQLYSEKLRKQNFALSPILPTCKRCGAEVEISHTCTNGTIIVLNGTCGSGKSTLAEILNEQDYLAIDGDCVLQVLKHKTGRAQIHFQEQAVFDEIAHQIDILSLFGDKFVLAHVIMPDDMNKYIEIFRARNLHHRFILLQPTYETAVARCQTRTCHTSITPEEWIKHFYDALVFTNGVEIIDNTHMTALQTVAHILN